jgi:hypothetical protein
MNAVVQFLHGILPVIGRVLAGVVGCFAFYIALFMYKSERDEWQNRLDNIWVEIDERAKKTDTRFTALVNDVARRLVRAFNWVFGNNRMSLQLVAVSVNMSLISMSLAWSLRSGYAIEWLGIIFYLCVVAVAITLHRWWIHAFCLSTILPLGAATVNLVWSIVTRQRTPSGSERAQTFGVLTVLVLSLMADTLAVVAIRSLFSRLADVPTIGGVLRAATVLLFISLLVCPLPLYLSAEVRSEESVKLQMQQQPTQMAHANVALIRYLSRTLYLYTGTDAEEQLGDVGNMNLITALYAMLPCSLLSLLVLHKFIWKLVARFIYPLMDFQIVRERKLLIPIGTAAFAIAFGLTTVMDVVKKYLNP